MEVQNVLKPFGRLKLIMPCKKHDARLIDKETGADLTDNVRSVSIEHSGTIRVVKLELIGVEIDTEDIEAEDPGD